MGRSGKDDLHLRKAPLSAVLAEAAEPHLDRGKKVLFTDLQGPAGLATRHPEILRRPELIHGLRNLVQNAVDFSRSTVWIDAERSASRVTVRIVDDGDGFPPHMIGRIGDPFLRARRTEPPAAERPAYEGMGLGLFIAKTRLERTGAELTFANAADPFLTSEERPDRCGAVVEVAWKLESILAPATLGQGRNTPIVA
jgi:two-component system sensor histidine kinase RegB